MHSAKLSEKRRYPYKFTGVAKQKPTYLHLETFASIFNEVNLSEFGKCSDESRGALRQGDVARQIAIIYKQTLKYLSKDSNVTWTAQDE